MVDYSKAKIFKIIDKKTNNVCICKTVQNISERMTFFKKAYAKFRANPKKVINDEIRCAFIVFQNDDYQAVFIKDIPCKSMEEVKMKYYEYIQTLDCVNSGFIKKLNKKTKFSIKKLDNQKQTMNDDLLIVF
jgi:hypothetical protein